MTRSKTTPKAANAGVAGSQYKPNKFVDIKLTENDREALRNREFDPGRFFDWVALRVMENYKFSLTRKYDGDEICASLYATNGVSDIAGREYTLTAWGSTVENALHALWYKFEVYCQDGFPVVGINRPAADFA
jgi:hypothetical protein